MRALAFTIAACLLIVPAAPAHACRIPIVYRSVFETEPQPPANASAYRGRLLTKGAALEAVRQGSYGVAAAGWDPETTFLSDLYLFGVIQNADGTTLRIYKSQLLLSCDNLFAHPLDEDIWIVGRPLPDDGQGQRVAMLAFRGDDRWEDN